MSDYLKSTNFATKDALPSGNAGKIVKGTELDNEFNAIADAVESKADLLNPTFSGLLTTDTLTTGGATSVGGTLAVAGTLSAAEDVQFTGTGRVLVPKGTTAQRPVSAASGSLRFNTTLGYLENYTGTEWRAVGYVTPADVSDQANTSTGYFQVPKGTVAQRPVSPEEGVIRYNSEVDIYEGYINGAWHRFLTANQNNYTVTYVLVGGGAGGGSSTPGGGAGQFSASTTTVIPATTVLTISIGAGGASGTSGNSSQIVGVSTAIGGNVNGTSGNGFSPGGGSGTSGFGGGGGSSGNGTPGYNSGTDGTPGYLPGIGGTGGPGTQTLITGALQTFAGGGGGSGYYGGGVGTAGGGNGGMGSPIAGNTAGTAATVNTGSGGGAGGFNTGLPGGAGGSGIAFLSVPTYAYTGIHTGSPTIIVTGSNTVMKFTSSGTYTC